MDTLPMKLNMTHDSQTEANRQVVRRAFDGWQSGSARVADIFDDELTWRIEGQSGASKKYNSKKQLLSELLVPFSLRFQSTDPFRPVSVRSLHADGSTVVVIWDGRGTATDGKLYQNSAAWFLTLRGGKVIDGTVFWDCAAYDALCARTLLPAPKPFPITRL